MKRVLSYFLAITMLISILPASVVFATGSENDVIIDFDTFGKGNPAIVPEGLPVNFNHMGLDVIEWRNNNTTDGILRVTLASNKLWPAAPTPRIAAIDVTVPADGYYSIKFRGGLSTYGSKTSVFIDSTYISGKYSDGQYLGDYDFTTTDASTTASKAIVGEEKELNTVYLTEGKHTVMFFHRTADTGTVYLFFKRLSLIYEGTEKPDFAEEIETDAPAKVSKGKMNTFSATVRLTDGSPLHIGDRNASGVINDKSYLAVTSENPELIEVRSFETGGIGNADKTVYTIRGKAPGDTSLIYTLYLDGEKKKEWKKPIHIDDSNDIIIDFAYATGNPAAAPAGEPYVLNSTVGLGNWRNQPPATNSVLRNEVVASPAWPESTNKSRTSAIDVTVPADGFYSVTFMGGASPWGGDSAVYIDDKYLGDYDFYEQNGVTTRGHSLPGEEKKFNTVYLTEGKHTIKFNARSVFAEDKPTAIYMFFHTLTLDYLEDMKDAETGDLMPDKLTAELPERPLPIGNSTSLTAKVTMSDGSDLYLGDYLSDGAADDKNYLDIKSDKSEVAEVTEVRKGGLDKTGEVHYTVNAKTAGKAKLIYTLYLGGESVKTWEQTIETTDTFDVIADFSACSVGNPSVPPAGAPFKFNTSLGAQEWRNNNTAGNVVRATITKQTWPQTISQWNAMAIDMEVPVSGYYNVSFKGGLAGTAGKSSVYIGDKYVGDYDFTSTNVKTNDAINSVDGEEKTLNTVYLEAGTNTVIFRNRTSHNITTLGSPNNAYYFFKKLSLIWVGKEAPSPSAIETELPEKLEKGIAAVADARIKMSDGSYLSLGEYNADATENTGDYLTVASDNSDIVEIRSFERGGLCNAENTSYKLIPKKAGKAVLTFTLYRGGEKAGEWTKNVSVEEATKENIVIDFDTFVVGNPASPLEGSVWSLNTSEGTAEWRNDITEKNTLRVSIGKEALWPEQSAQGAAIDVITPKSGYYSVSFKGALSQLGAKVSVYAGDKYIGDYDFTTDNAATNAISSVEGEEQRLNTVYLSEGKNTISFRMRSAHEAEDENAYLFLRKLSFIYEGENAPVPEKLNAALPVAGQIVGMLLGEKRNIGAVIMMSDGSALYLGDYNADGSINSENRLEIISDKPESVEVSNVEKGGLCNSANTAYTISAKSAGEVVLTYTLYLDGKAAKVWTESFSALPEMQKTEPTIYTYEMRENAIENAKKYDWAKTLRNTAVTNADKYIENLDKIYDMIIGEGLPRSMTAAMRDDPESYTCVYCGEDLREQYNAYEWGIDPINRPWKMQCVYCKRLFPSNDFGSFFELGHVPEGFYNEEHETTEYFDISLARQRHHEMLFHPNGEECTCTAPSEEYTDAWYEYYGYGNENGYLYNSLYKEVGKDLSVDADKVSRWAVDDGFGWDTGEYTDSGMPIRKGFIAFYGFSIWSYGSPNRFITKALEQIRDAYLYTGDIKYGRAGAILIDRVADVYPSYKWDIHCDWQHSQGGWNNGKIDGVFWERQLAHCFAQCYDAFWPAMDDPQVIEYLSKKAEENALSNKKLNGDMIRRNCEDNICREIFREAKNARILSNFPNHQSTVIYAAIALDSMPDTQEMFDWMHIPSTVSTRKEIHHKGKAFYIAYNNTGGELMTNYVDKIDRDGFAEEVSQLYNQGRVTQTLDIAEAIRTYEMLKGYDVGLDFYDSPKFKKMFYAIFNMTMAGNYTLQIGDEYGTAGIKNNTNEKSMLYGIERFGDMSFAQRYWAIRNGDMSRAYIGMFEKDAGELAGRIEDYVKEHGEIKLQSRNLAGYGLATLRDGDKISGAQTKDLRRDTWLWYGRSDASHGHLDTLQMGVDAYGFNFTPDLGYPSATSYDPNRLQWVSNTLSHNTVVVNGEKQKQIRIGTPLHFDDTGRVGVIDVEAPEVYDVTDIYRRTLVTVEAAEGDAYTVDFFRVKGGNEHIYSFHTQSFNGVTADGLELVPQNGGTYAGENTKYGEDPNTQNSNSYETKYPRGYTWLRNVQRDNAPADGHFSVNFKQTDFNKQVSDAKGLNLKWTALNDWTPSSVGIATAETPRLTHNKNIPELDYMLVHRTGGDNLDTLFTSVIEPYNGSEYIESMESVELAGDGTEEKGDKAKAIKVKLKSGRCDYIIYATNNNVEYTLTDGETSFVFRGFIGVYSVNENGANIYSYINDGALIGDMQTDASVGGKIVDFEKKLLEENYITVELEREMQASELAGRYIYIDNSSERNGAYKIEAAEVTGKTAVLDIGDVTLVKQYRDSSKPELGFLYNIAEGDSFTIPLSAEAKNAPVVETAQNGITTSAGSSVNVNISAASPAGETLTYLGTHLPRGASINSETGVITWKPDASQVGEHGFLITARDESGRESTITFDVMVYGSTTGKPSDSAGNSGDSSGDTTTPSGGGGGGGGGGAAPTPDTETTPDDKESTDETDNNQNDGETVPDASGETELLRFTDLSNHAWAADAINTLADDGIVKGTTASTYSPANNITRADFALLLVRAFDLESDNTENFADVAASDYFAQELAVARNTGIVNGIGDNKYAPRSTITRQDMMVIVYRALEALGVEMKESDAAKADTYPDYADVSEYAKEAVEALIASGLVNGKSGKIAPKDYTTRAEVAVLLKRILDYIQ